MTLQPRKFTTQSACSGTPLVSVIIPVYNGERHIAEALKSLQEQTYGIFEAVIVDDGSTDGTRDAILPFLDDTRFRYFEQPNKGVSSARNAALAQAQGDYVCFLDSDDAYAPTKIEEQVSLAVQADADFVYCNCWVETKSGDVRLLRDDFPWSERQARRMMASVNALHPSVIMVSRRVADMVGRFDESLSTCEDYDYWLRSVSAARRIAGDGKPLAHVRYRPESLSHSAPRMEVLTNRYNVLAQAAGRESDRRIARILRRRVRRVRRDIWMAAAKEYVEQRPYAAALCFLRSWTFRPLSLRPLFLAILLAIPLPQTRRAAMKVVLRRR